MQATGELQKQEQQQQQHEEGQEDRWSTLLCDVLLPHLTSGQQQEPAPGHPAAAIHRLDRRHRQAARASLRHLPLCNIALGRSRLRWLQEEAQQHTDRAAAAKAAAATSALDALSDLPWGVLTAAPHITALEVDARQLTQLIVGCSSDKPAAYTAEDTSTSSGGGSSSSIGGTSSRTRGSILCAHLARLRSLSITSITCSSQVWWLGWLLVRCPQLTQLLLSMGFGLDSDDRNFGAQLLDGWDLATSRAAEAAAEAGIQVPALQLPPIQHLEVSGPCRGLPDAWLSLPGAAARLTALHLTYGSAPGLSSYQLQACSNLQELVITPSAVNPDMRPNRDLPRHLVHLTALTKLVLVECGLTALRHSLWCLTGLRHLNLAHNRVGKTLPSHISALRQLRVLDLSFTGLRELPRALGAWLPELEELCMTGTAIWRLPSGLTRLTRLEATACRIRYVSYLQHLVHLKQLLMKHSILRPPLQQLSRLTALETLELEWEPDAPHDEGPISWQGAWPRLRMLSLEEAPLAVLCALPGTAFLQQLTELHLDGLRPSCMDIFQQLGVLPQLKSVYLGATYSSSSDEDTLKWAPAAPWLQQQPKLTRLFVHGGVVEVTFLEQLPLQLEDMCLSGVKAPQLQEWQLSALTRLKQLRYLGLPDRMLTCLPPWLSCLSRLEVLTSHDSNIQSGWEVLAALPLLRRLRCGNVWGALEHAQHLCWAY